MLTIQEIKNTKASDKPRKLFDRDGLYLFVTPAGIHILRRQTVLDRRSRIKQKTIAQRRRQYYRQKAA